MSGIYMALPDFVNTTGSLEMTGDIGMSASVKAGFQLATRLSSSTSLTSLTVAAAFIFLLAPTPQILLQSASTSSLLLQSTLTTLGGQRLA